MGAHNKRSARFQLDTDHDTQIGMADIDHTFSQRSAAGSDRYSHHTLALSAASKRSHLRMRNRCPSDGLL